MAEASNLNSGNHALFAVSVGTLVVAGISTLAYSARQKRAQERKAMDAFLN